MNKQTHTGQVDQQTAYCNWHSGIETRLSCGKCGRHICKKCLVHSSVGIRCSECGEAIKIPTFEVPPSAYIKGAVVGVVLAVGCGAIWGMVNFILINLGLVVLASAALPGLIVGYAAGELINGAANAKRSKGLAYIAGGSVVGAFVFAQMLYSGRVGFVGLIVLAIAMYLAVQRVK